MVAIKTNQTPSVMRRSTKNDVKLGSLEDKLSLALTKPKVMSNASEKKEALKEIGKIKWLEESLSDRDKLIAGALGFKGFPPPDWASFLATLDKTPKLNIEVVKTIFDQAISRGHATQLLYFGCTSTKNLQLIITQMLHNKIGLPEIEHILNLFTDSSISKSEQKKLQKSIHFLSTVIGSHNKSQFTLKLVSFLASIDDLPFATIKKPQKKEMLTSIVKIFLQDNFSEAFSTLFSSKFTCTDELIRQMIRNLNSYGIDEHLLVTLILKLSHVGRIDAINEKSIFAKFSIDLIASLLFSKEIIKFLLDERDSYKSQFRGLLRQGGIGAVMQIMDQKRDFDLIVKAEHAVLIEYVASNQSRSSALIELLITEQINVFRKAFIKDADIRMQGVNSEKEKVLSDLKNSREITKELEAKVKGLEGQLRLEKRDQISEHGKMIQQAQLQVLIEFSKFVEDLRVLLKGSFEADINVRSVHNNAEAKLRKLSVVIVGEIGTSPSDIQKYFKIDSVIGVDEKVVKSPAYIFRTDEQEVVLVWGELRDK